MLHCKLDYYSVFFGFAVNGQIVEFSLAFVEIQDVIYNAAVVFERLGIEFVVVAKIGKFYRKSAIEKRKFA
ncbi:unknown [Acidiphilium sp. CAG:727]|nr:unknown [Acidiphilium sp. CAG:727]